VQDAEKQLRLEEIEEAGESRLRLVAETTGEASLDGESFMVTYCNITQTAFFKHK
jgi:hypothetical protein